MDSIKIFIDTDTEITFILEKILEARTDRVCLVVPDRAAVMTSIIGLKLIKHIVDKSNKLLVIVTFDEQGTELARKAGLIVVARVGDVNEAIWEQALRDKFVFRKNNMKPHYVPSNVSAAVDEDIEEVVAEGPEVKELPYTVLEDEESEVVTEALVEEYQEEQTEEIVEERAEVPVIEITVPEDDEKEAEIQGIPNFHKLDEDDVVEKKNNTVEEKEKTQKPTHEVKDIVVEPRQRIRKTTPKNAGISNLSFTVGKDVSEKKTKRS